MDYYSDLFIFEQGIMYNYTISTKQIGYRITWCYGYNLSSEKKKEMNIIDIIDVALLIARLQKLEYNLIRKDVNNWNKHSPIL